MIDSSDRRQTLMVRACLALLIFGIVHTITSDYWPALVLAGIALGTTPQVPNLLV